MKAPSRHHHSRPDAWLRHILTLIQLGAQVLRSELANGAGSKQRIEELTEQLAAEAEAGRWACCAGASAAENDVMSISAAEQPRPRQAA